MNFGRSLSAALNLLTFRGPDDWGEYCDEETHVYLGHRRLSVIDLSDFGHQPMSLQDESLHLTYNGEVYNFSDIRRRYFDGVKFASRTDTEVILRSFQKFGHKTPELLRGMFAFGVYNKQKKEIFLCRDRLGIKPLYFYHKEGQFAFASEINALRALPGIDLDFDPIGLDHYFRCGYIPAPFSAYKYIRKLKPAHRLVYDIARDCIIINEPYWHLKDQLEPDVRRTEQEWIEAIEDKIREAINLRLVSDVPLGAFLSGGLDSSLVVALMTGLTDKPVKTFTIGFDEQQFDERDHADIVARRFGTEHHVEVVKPDAKAILPKLIESFGEPFYDPSAIPTYYVSQIARQHITVALSGDGGDEVFAGYDHYRRLHNYNAYNQTIPLSIRKSIQYFGKAIPKHLRGYGVLQRQGCRDEAELFHTMRDLFQRGDLRQLYSNDYQHRMKDTSPRDYEQFVHQRNGHDDDFITRLQLTDLYHYLPEDILTKVDRMSMVHSLETRVPLLDHELVELVFSAPASLRFRKGNLKYILKQILADKVPPRLIRRKKQGFSLPISHWFRHEWKDYMQDLISTTKDDPFLNTSYVRQVFQMHQKGGRNFGHALYAILFYKSWLATNGF